jgi:raffinose/stachyose/melibiose transport system permease protein
MIGAAAFRRLWRQRLTILFLAPSLLLLIVFQVAPNVLNLFYAFTNWSTYGNGTHWEGLYNFRLLYHSQEARSDLVITLEYAAIVTVLMNVGALALALALEKTNRLNGILRSIFFIPVLISTLAAGYIFRALFDIHGPINAILGAILFRHVEIAWFGSQRYTLVLLAIIHAWRLGGIMMLVYIAALNAIPDSLIEAARIEGASAWRIITRIKLPMIGAAFTFSVTLTLIGALSIFDLIIATTGGGPAGSTEVLNMYVYQEYGQGLFGFATAIALVLFVVICLCALPLVFFLRRREVEY